MGKKDKPQRITAEAAQKVEEQQVKIPVDEWHGMGGSYVIDPETGKRVRVAGPDLDDAPAEESVGTTVSTDAEVLTDEIK